MRRRGAAAALAASAAIVAACGTGKTSQLVSGANPQRGRQLISSYGCGACHVIGGVQTARGHVGPSLTGFDSLGSIAGKLPNTPPNVERWIQHPQQINPGTLMPDLGVSPKDAADITAYLYGQ